MKKIFFLFILNACASLIIAQSAITLSNTNMPGSGDTLRFTNFQVNTAGNYTQTGTNHTWDFTNVTSTTEGMRNFKYGWQTPYSVLFGINGYGEKIADTIGAGPLTLTNYYNFYKKQTSPVNAFIADGVGMTFSGTPIPSYYSDKDELYNFPMTYPKYDSTTFKFTTTTAGIIPISYSKVGYRVTVVDGWGIVKTPYGIENCLRLITTQYASDSIKNTIFPFPLGFPNFQRSYQWMTVTSKIPYVEITGSLLGGNFTPTQAKYRGYSKEVISVGLNEQVSESGVSFYPNPVKDQLHLVMDGKAESSYEIYSVDGKRVTTINTTFTGTHAELDVSSLEAGIYLVKITGDQKDQHLKFIKE